MDITIYPKKLSGTASAIPSKSQAHRLLICSAFSDTCTQLLCPETNQDIEATAGCLRALGANITRTQNGYIIDPICTFPNTCQLNCGESGSTLRFMLPIVGALGVDTIFSMAGRLPSRPLSPLWELMEENGCKLQRLSNGCIHCSGKLKPGIYTINGNVSSQFISGLLFAGAIMNGCTQIRITGKLESAPYVDMTKATLALFGVHTENFKIYGALPFHSQKEFAVEGDWSNAAFFLAANVMGNNVNVVNLSKSSAQGDRAITDLLQQLDTFVTISASDVPDLIPILSVAAAGKKGAVFTNIQRLRIKESDRVASVENMLKN